MAGIRLETSVQTEHPAASRVTLVIDPLLSPQAVLETYSELRHKVLEGSYRPLGEKHLRLAVFAAERRPPAKWAEVMQAWMNSAGHRANILGNYAYIGVGYVPCSKAGGLFGRTTRPSQHGMRSRC